MRLMPILGRVAALGILGAGLVAPPAAQQPVKPICANCHERQHDTILLTAHGAKNHAGGSMCQTCHGDAT